MTAFTLPPLSLYIHIPWCVKKCPYCDFNSHEAHTNDGIPVDAYLQRMTEDLINDLPLIQGREIVSIFFGGGTPSIMPGNFYLRLFDMLTKHLTFSTDIEITLEANPGTFDEAHFKDYRTAGINRLSIGMQSFDAEKLKILGRIHNPEQAKQAYLKARDVGFDNINIDLMFALPTQSLDQAMSDLQQGIDLKPEHLSWYQLTIEQNTEFYRQQPTLPEDDDIWEIHTHGQALLADHGYQQYEISAYSQPKKPSKHNLNYWSFGDYLGLGAGAHGKITHSDGSVTRSNKTRLPKDYLSANRISFGQTQTIAPEDLLFEFMMNALRLKDGVASELFEQRTGRSLDSIKDKLHPLVTKGLLLPPEQKIATTVQGYNFLNAVLEELV
jgi:putative oxygen-independent coproporphyrinogen III oxidase